MKRRVFAWAAALALMIALLPAARAAETQFVVKSPGSAARAGGTFTVAVELTGNPGFCAMQFTLVYDSGKMTCTRVTPGGLLANMVCETNPNAGGGARIAAAGTENRRGDGLLATFEFTAAANVSEFSFQLANVGLYNESGARIPWVVTGAKNAGSEALPPSPVLDPTTPGGTGTTPDKPEETETTPQGRVYPDTIGHWGADWIAKASAMGLFVGGSDGLFHPDDDITRADYVLVLWRSAGSPKPTGAAPFKDIPAGAYYAEAVAWAAERGYVSGKGGGKFDPSASLTRQEAMKILFGYAGGTSGEEAMLTQLYDASFTDSGDIAGWARAAMYWGVYHKIISGAGDGTLAPTGTATRAQLAKILVVYLENSATA